MRTTPKRQGQNQQDKDKCNIHRTRNKRSATWKSNEATENDKGKEKDIFFLSFVIDLNLLYLFYLNDVDTRH